MSRSKKGQKSFTTQWVTSSFPPSLGWLYLKTKPKTFKASCNFLKALVAHSDFILFLYFRKKQRFPQTPQALPPAKLKTKQNSPQPFNTHAFPILVLYSLDFSLLRKY